MLETLHGNSNTTVVAMLETLHSNINTTKDVVLNTTNNKVTVSNLRADYNTR